MLAIDTETTGLDVYHGARPFFVTTCNERGEQDYYEWEVDPYTRCVRVPDEELLAVKKCIEDHLAVDGLLVLQNSKFDVAMLRAIFAERLVDFEWNWDRTHDTLVMGHILASNKPHDLTSMSIQYLRHNIRPLEDALENCVKRARTWCQHRLKEWRIAKAGLEEMPSARDKTWKYDSWLPRRLAFEMGHPKPAEGCTDELGDLGHQWGAGDEGFLCHRCGGHRWYVALREYANADSEVTAALAQVMRSIIEKRGLWEIYDVRRRAMELAHRMEYRGVTGSAARTDEIEAQYMEESQEAGARCVDIARQFNYDLTLPKTGNNNSLKYFCFGEPKEDRHGKKSLNPVSGAGIARRWLDLPVVGWTEGGEPSMNKAAMDEYEAILERDSVQWEFLVNLSMKRKRDTAISYIQGYRRFWLPSSPNGTSCHEGVIQVSRVSGFPYFVLHPNLNPCGTDTLRWSSSQPNEQNISKQGMRCLYCFGDGEGDGPDGKCTHCKGKGVDPKNLRYCFGPPPGYEWWSLDAKNIELRLPFYKAGEQALIELFERPDDPPYYGSNHLLNFHTIYPDLWEQELSEVGPEKVGPHCKKKYASTWYQYCKNMGFAKQYGAQRAKVDATAKRKGSYDLIESRFNRLSAYNRKMIDFANRYGYIETIPDREVNPLKGYPLLCTRTENGSILPTVPLSYHVQGSAMWWTFKAMLRVQAKLDEWRARDGFDGYIAMQVHDELVVGMPRRGDPTRWNPKDSGAENRKIFQTTNLWRVWIIKKLMARGGDDLGVPTPVGVEYHSDNWGEGVTFA